MEGNGWCEGGVWNSSVSLSVTRRYHRSEWLSRLNQGGALLAIGSEEETPPPDRKCGLTGCA